MDRLAPHLFYAVASLLPRTPLAWLGASRATTDAFNRMDKIVGDAQDVALSALRIQHKNAMPFAVSVCRRGHLLHFHLPESKRYTFVEQMTLLAWGAVHGRLSIFRFMKEWGLSPECLRDRYCQVLAYAAMHGQLEVCHFLRGWGLLPRDACQVFTSKNALRLAARHGRLEVCQFLLDWVAMKPDGKIDRLTMRDVRSDDNYALRKACKHGHLGVVRLLKDWDDGIGPKLTLRDVRSDNNYALRKAAACGRLEILHFLRDWTDPHILLRSNTKPLKNASSACMVVAHNVMNLYLPLNLEDVRNAGGYALYMAAHNGHLDVLKFLLAWQDPTNKGVAAQLTIYDVQDRVLHMAAAGGQLAILQFLRGWVDPNGARLTRQDVLRRDNFALMLASTGGHREAVWFLKRWVKSKQ